MCLIAISIAVGLATLAVFYPKKEEVEEGFAEKGHGAGAMSRSVAGKVNYSPGGSSKARKHGNSAPHLDDKVKGDIKFKNGGKSTVRKHGNSAPGLEPKTKGEFLK